MPKLRQSSGLPDFRYYTQTEIDTMLSDGTIDHLNLSNIGVNTHAQIDVHIADNTIHFTEASIDHTAILNIGVNTHAQIDTFIAATVGTINSYGGAVAPTGWLLCNGAVINRITYADLFTAIGTNFNVGGEPGTDFRIPDLRGIFQRGAGTSGQLSDANSNAFAGVLGTYQNDKMQGHIHRLIGVAFNEDAHAGSEFSPWTGGSENSNRPTGVPRTDGSSGTPRTGDETNPANLGLTFIIKY